MKNTRSGNSHRACAISVVTLISVLCIGILVGMRGYFAAEMNAVDDPLSFSIVFGESVAMHVSTSIHYDLDSVNAEEQWSHLLPSSGHVVHVYDEKYTVTLFHQLKCLDIIRQQYITRDSGTISTMTRHCMNYLRQTILCRPNLSLESVTSPLGTVGASYEAVCRDWTRIYDVASRNHEAHMQRRNLSNYS